MDDIAQTFNTPTPKEYGGTGTINGAPSRVAVTTDNAVVRFDGTTGEQQNSGVTITDNAQGSFQDQGVDFRNRSIYANVTGFGGTQADLTTSFVSRVNVSFVARQRSIYATGRFYIDQDGAIATVVESDMRLIDVTAGNVLTKTSPIILARVNAGPLAAAANITNSISFDDLTLGRTYRVELRNRKLDLVGPIYGRSYTIDGINA